MTPPEEWTPRNDASTRKVVARLDELTKKVDGLEESLMEKLTVWLTQQLKAFVNWPAFAGVLVGFLGLAALVATAVASPAKEKAAQVEARQEKSDESVAKKLDTLVEKVTQLEIRAAEQRATYRVVVDQVPRAQAKQELQRSKAEER